MLVLQNLPPHTTDHHHMWSNIFINKLVLRSSTDEEHGSGSHAVSIHVRLHVYILAFYIWRIFRWRPLAVSVCHFNYFTSKDAEIFAFFATSWLGPFLFLYRPCCIWQDISSPVRAIASCAEKQLNWARYLWPCPCRRSPRKTFAKTRTAKWPKTCDPWSSFCT